MATQLNILSQESRPLIPVALDAGPLSSDLDKLKGKRILFRNNYSKECIPLQSLSDPFNILEILHLREFSPNPIKRRIAAVDSSCALIGETEDGAVYAGRVVAVHVTKSKGFTYSRLGPIIIYLQPNGKAGFCGLTKRAVRLMLSDKMLAERFIRTWLERWVQLDLAKNFENSLILVDGGLRSSDLEPQEFSLRVIEGKSQENSNQILGISKASSLRLISSLSSQLDSRVNGSIFLDVTDPIRTLTPCLRCRVLVVRFSTNATVFRVDSSLSNSESDSQVLSDLKFNDVIFRGYPESLRLAHHLSIFDLSTVNSIRAYLSRKYGLVSIPNDDLRATILGKLV